MNSLYCYLASEGLVFLKRGYLPFFAPEQMPEPWLQKNSCYQSSSEPILAAVDFSLHLQQQYQKLPSHLRDMVSFEYFEQQSQNKREQIEQSMVVQKKQQDIKPFLSERVKDWRLLSLFESWHNISRWQQNAASGLGLVVEFDLAKSGFQAASYNQQAQHFSAINWVGHWQPTDDLYYLLNRPLSLASINGSSKEGSEGDVEWRLLRSLKAADRKIKLQGSERAMYRLPTRAVKRVILGYCCSQEYCQEVKSYLSKDINYRHVDCVQAQIDPKTMGLQQVAI